MTARMTRKMVKIDEDKCNGCGLCVPSCAEGALRIIDGKARLVADKYCDGLGACLGECPQGAISIEEREADEFDEAAARQHLAQHREAERERPVRPAQDRLCGCPSTTVTEIETVTPATPMPAQPEARPVSRLTHWPVQLTLVPATAPFLQDADVVLVADCVPFAYPALHQDFLKDHAVLVACPKLDNFPAHQAKLTDVLRRSAIKSLTVVHMEVPCCSGLTHMARQATRLSGREVPLQDVTISIRGEVKE